MKKIAKALLPEFLLQLFRGIRETRYRMRQTYAGVYASFDNVATAGGGDEDDEWPLTAAQYSRWAIARTKAGLYRPLSLMRPPSCLYLSLFRERPRSRTLAALHGFSYIAAKYGAMRDIDRYVIVEHPNVCAQGRELFKDECEGGISRAYPEEQFDLVLIGTALQYVSNYKELLMTTNGGKAAVVPCHQPSCPLAKTSLS